MIQKSHQIIYIGLFNIVRKLLSKIISYKYPFKIFQNLKLYQKQCLDHHSWCLLGEINGMSSDNLSRSTQLSSLVCYICLLEDTLAATPFVYYLHCTPSTEPPLNLNPLFSCLVLCWHKSLINECLKTNKEMKHLLLYLLSLQYSVL